MIKVINSISELSELIGEKIDEGREGISYMIPNLYEVLKIYKESPKELLFMDEKSLYIAFPNDIYQDDNGNILASTMLFMNGNKIENGFSENLEINKLLEAFNILMEEISKYPDIYMSDICLDNILYDSLTNRFNLIDTTLWKNWKDSIGLNIARIHQNLAHALYMNIAWLDEEEFWKNNYNFKRNYLDSKNEGFVNFLEFLNQTIEVISKYYNKEIITIGDLNIKSKKKY